MWSYHSRSMTPSNVASEFARTAFDDRRQVDLDSMAGEWTGRCFYGSFRLIDGVRTYNLTGDGYGNWTVEPAS